MRTRFRRTSAGGVLLLADDIVDFTNEVFAGSFFDDLFLRRRRAADFGDGSFQGFFCMFGDSRGSNFGCFGCGLRFFCFFRFVYLGSCRFCRDLLRTFLSRVYYHAGSRVAKRERTKWWRLLRRRYFTFGFCARAARGREGRGRRRGRTVFGLHFYFDGFFARTPGRQRMNRARLSRRSCRGVNIRGRLH